MSSPKATLVKRASGTPRHLVTRGGAKSAPDADGMASDDGMSRTDKVNFIKAMMEGVKPKATAPQGAAAKPNAAKGKGAAAKADAAKGKSKAKPKAAAEKPKKVEILRKIPAVQAAPVRSNPESDAALQFAAMLEKKLAAGDLEVLTPQAVQALVTALAKLYSANIDAGNKYPVVAHRMAISGTDAMILCGALLKAVDLQVFELGMWQSWSGL